MLALLFSDQHARTLVYVHQWGKWMRWAPGIWREDFAVTVFDEARKICASEGERAIAEIEKSGTAIAARINKASCIAAIERLARHHRPHARADDEFDADLALLNMPDKCVSLCAKPGSKR